MACPKALDISMPDATRLHFPCFPRFCPFCFRQDHSSEKTTLVLRERNFLRETRGGDPWPNLNSTSIDDSDDDRSETVPINRICGKRTSDSDLTTPVEDQNSRDNQNVAPKTQPRPPRPHPKLLLRLHANRPARRRPHRSHLLTKHQHPLRQRPPTPFLRIRHFQRTRAGPCPPPLFLLLRLTPPPPRAAV